MAAMYPTRKLHFPAFLAPSSDHMAQYRGVWEILGWGIDPFKQGILKSVAHILSDLQIGFAWLIDISLK